MSYREQRAVDRSAEGVDDRESPASIVNFTQGRFTNAVAICVDELEDGHASNGSRSLDLEVVHLGKGRDEAMETAVAAGIVHFRGVSKKLTDRGYPRFVDSPVVRSVVEWAKFDGDSAAAASIWESRMNRSGSYQPSRNRQYPELYSIGAEQSFPARISHLEVVIPVGKSSRRWRSTGSRPAVEIYAGGAALRAVTILVNNSTGNISSKDCSRNRRRCGDHRSLRDRDQQRSEN